MATGERADQRIDQTVPTRGPLGLGRNHPQTPGTSHWVRAMPHFTQSGRIQRTPSHVPRRALCQPSRVLKQRRPQWISDPTAHWTKLRWLDERIKYILHPRWWGPHETNRHSKVWVSTDHNAQIRWASKATGDGRGSSLASKGSEPILELFPTSSRSVLKTQL